MVSYLSIHFLSIRFIPVHIHLLPSASYSPAISSPPSPHSLLSSLLICTRRSLPPDLDYEIDSSVFFSSRRSFHLLPAHSLSITMKISSEIVLDIQNFKINSSIISKRKWHKIQGDIKKFSIFHKRKASNFCQMLCENILFFYCLHFECSHYNIPDYWILSSIITIRYYPGGSCSTKFNHQLKSTEYL